MRLGILGSAVLAAGVFLSAPVVHAQSKDDKAAKEKEKRDKDLAKAKEDLEKKFKGKKEDPAPAISFLSTLVESGNIDVPKAKDVVDKVMSKKIPWDEASKAADKAISDNPKDPKKTLKDLTDWISKWKPKPKEDPKKPAAPADPKADPKKGP